MIQVIRYGVFETNSSTSHSFTLLNVKSKLGINGSTNSKALESALEKRTYYKNFIRNHLVDSVRKIRFFELFLKQYDEFVKEIQWIKYSSSLKTILEKENAFDSYIFMCDRKIYSDDLPDFDVGIDFDGLRNGAEKFFSSIENVETTCQEIVKIVLDQNIVIEQDVYVDY